jgi:hypothetical protein
MLAKTTIALATAAVLGVVSVAQAATRDKGDKAGPVRIRVIQLQPLNYERYGSPRLPQAPHPILRDDDEGYPHPK